MKKLFLLVLLGFLPIFAMVKEEVEYTDEKGRVFPMLVLGADLTGDEVEPLPVVRNSKPKRSLKRCKINNSVGRELLFACCRSDDLDLLKAVIDKEKTPVNIKDASYFNQTPLHIAVDEGHLEIMNFLLKRGAAIDIRDNNGCTPLYLSVFQSNALMADTLCNAGADVNLTNNDGESPLHEAVRTKFFPCVNVLLASNKTKVSAQNDNGNTPLHIALQYYKSSDDSKNIIKSLLACGANLNVRNKKKQTPRAVATKQAKLFLKLRDRKQRNK